MYRYKYNKSYHHKSRRARRTTVLAVLFSAVVVGASAYIVYDLIKQNTKKDEPVSQSTVTSVQGASINLFRTEYFQFQADASWKEVVEESKANKFVYRSYNGPLVEHDLLVEVNPSPEVVPLARTTHVLPVQIEASGQFSLVDGAGSHCGTQVPKGTPHVPLRVTQKQVSFICSVDAVIYQVQIGAIGGSTDISINHGDGSKAIIRITYRNLKFTPDDNIIRNIISTFQTR